MAHTIIGVWLNRKVSARIVARELWQQLLDRSLQETHCSLQHMDLSMPILLTWCKDVPAMIPRCASLRESLWYNKEMRQSNAPLAPSCVR